MRRTGAEPDLSTRAGNQGEPNYAEGINDIQVVEVSDWHAESGGGERKTGRAVHEDTDALEEEQFIIEYNNADEEEVGEFVIEYNNAEEDGEGLVIQYNNADFQQGGLMVVDPRPAAEDWLWEEESSPRGAKGSGDASFHNPPSVAAFHKEHRVDKHPDSFERDVKETFVCDRCPSKPRYRSQKRLYSHLRRDHHDDLSGKTLRAKINPQMSSARRQSGPGKVKPKRRERKSQRRKIFFCQVCQSNCRTQNDLDAHSRRHAKKTATYPCVLCPQVYATVGGQTHLMKHYQEEHPGIVPTCPLCEKTFKGLGAFLCHHARHTVVTPFYCSQCKTYQKTERGLVVHLRIDALRNMKDASNDAAQ